MYKNPLDGAWYDAEDETDDDGEEEDEEDEGEDTPQDDDESRSKEFEKALEELLPRLLPHAHTSWRPAVVRERRVSPRYVHVRCPVFDCFHCCLVDMVAGMQQLGAALTAAGWGADRLPEGPVRDVLTRPSATAAAAATAAAGGSSGAGGSGSGTSAGGGAGAAGGSGACGGREFVEWTDLPGYAQRAVRQTARWCWFSGGHPGPSAYSSVAAHLRHNHSEPEGLPLIQRLLRVPGGSEREPFRGAPRALMTGMSYSAEPLVAPDDPRVVAFSEELEELVADHWPWTAARRWGDEVVAFGPNSDLELPCPVPGCNKAAVIDMAKAYDSFKVGLRSVLKAEEVPDGPLRDCMVSEQGHFGRRMCFRGWASLPRHAQLGFIRAARWRWFDEEWHTNDPYHGLRLHFAMDHGGDEEAARLQALLMDRRGEEAEDTRDNPTRARMREMEALIQQALQKRRAHEGDGDGGGAAGPASSRFRR